MANRKIQFYSEQVFAITPVSIPARLRQTSGKSVTWSADQVIAELIRTPENSRHVSEPTPPQAVYGFAIERLLEYIDTLKSLAASKVETYFRRGREHVRAVRATTPILLSAVASYPEPIMEDTEARRKWVALVIEAANARWGKKFRCAVGHSDEGFYHLHLLVDNVGESVKPLHMAHAAAAAEASTKAKGAAYRAGGRALQDWYFKAVGEVMGWARGAPKPQPGRISRPAALSARQAKLEAEEVRQQLVIQKMHDAAEIQKKNHAFVVAQLAELKKEREIMAAEKDYLLNLKNKINSDMSEISEIFAAQNKKAGKSGIFGNIFK